MFFFMLVNSPAEGQVQRAPELDEALFARIAEGDRAAFETLYFQSERAIYAYALSLVKNPHDALDIVQDTYLKVRAAAHLYQPQGKPLAWMFTIARNLSRNQMRMQKRDVSADELCLADDASYSYISDPTDRLVLEMTLKILDEGEREIILLHVISGLKHREIADHLDTPLATVLSRYHRGLKKLRRHLTQGGWQHG